MVRYHALVNALGFAMPGLLAWHRTPPGGVSRSMRVIIAGGTGFLGRHVAGALVGAGHSVLLLARGTRPTLAGDGIEILRTDVATGALPLEAMRGSDALVNLIGIKREQGTQTFERVHVESTRHLVEAAKVLGVRRLVHISVVCSRPDPGSAYHDTKWRGEELVRAAGLDDTILKPGVIYGPGDDMVTHLVKMIRFAPVFPVVGRGDSLLQPVHVGDVAAAAVGALGNDRSIGKRYDVVGPERLTLRAVVETVARGVGLPLRVVGTPIWFQRAAVALMNALFRNPLSTPAQLQMLIDGLYGDPAPARDDLGVEPRPFTVEEVRKLAGPIPPLFGVSLRLRAVPTQMGPL
jgi:NADH dehydrogenase